MGLRIAVVGYNLELSCQMIREIARRDQSTIRMTKWDKVFMEDGTVYQAVSSSSLNRIDGCRFDQMIITDDERWYVFDQQQELIGFLKYQINISSCVSEEFRIQTFPYI